MISLLLPVFPPMPSIGSIYLEAREQGSLGNVVSNDIEHVRRSSEWT